MWPGSVREKIGRGIFKMNGGEMMPGKDQGSVFGFVEIRSKVFYALIGMVDLNAIENWPAASLRWDHLVTDGICHVCISFAVVNDLHIFFRVLHRIDACWAYTISDL